MKNICAYDDEKYQDAKFKKIDEHIWSFEEDGETRFVTTLTFEQEPEFDEEEEPSYISQYPLEDILDKFSVWISDFYSERNASSEKTCYQEFCSYNADDIRELLGIVGKHVYNKTVDEKIILAIE